MSANAEAVYSSYWTDFYREFSPSLYEDRPRFLLTLNPPEPCAQPQIEIHNGSQACFIRAGIDVDQSRANIELVTTDYGIYQADMLPNMHALNPFVNFAEAKTADCSVSSFVRPGEYGLRFERHVTLSDRCTATGEFGVFCHAQSVVWLAERIKWTTMGPYGGAKPASLDSLMKAVSYWVNIHAAEDIAEGPDLVETIGTLLGITPTEVLLALFDNPTHLIRELEQAHQTDYAQQIKELTHTLWDDWCGILQTE